ncbi:MAG: type II toxin-antitoxin system RelE/ParE family toxin [Rhizomicrobium sp.]
MKVIFTQRAKMHELNLYVYVAENGGEAAAERFVGAIHKYCCDLKAFPYRGTSREDLGIGVRTLGYKRRATILYRVQNDTVVIGGVYYGGRSLEDDSRSEWDV